MVIISSSSNENKENCFNSVIAKLVLHLGHMCMFLIKTSNYYFEKFISIFNYKF